MPKKGSRKIGSKWYTEEELLEAGKELAALFSSAERQNQSEGQDPKWPNTPPREE